MSTETIDRVEPTQKNETQEGRLLRRFDDSQQTLATARDQHQCWRGDAWARLCKGFLRCHRSPLNVAIHCVTTPLGIFGVCMVLAWASPVALLATLLIQAAVVAYRTPRMVALMHTLLLGAIGAAAIQLTPSLVQGLVCLAAGFAGQEAAHWLSSERTFQSTYKGNLRWWGNFVEHTILLMPVLMVLACRWRQSPFRLLVARKAIHKTKLNSLQNRDDFDAILRWVREKQPTFTQSTHWWQDDLDGSARAAATHLCHSEQLQRKIQSFHGTGYSVRPVLGMNEIYVTGPSKKSSSDTVFYMGHVDGPWAVAPGARLYRCMLALNDNLEVTTHFPMATTDYEQPEGHRLENGDAVAFDFNRELHFITRSVDDRQTEPRVNFKLHFVAYPTALSWYGGLLDRLTTWYDIRARGLFLKTIDPNSLLQKIKARWVLGWTALFETVVRYLGWTNLAYVAVAMIGAFAASDVRVFLCTTSFVHYGMYVGTIRERTPVSFGTFRRNAMFFKLISMAQLFSLYAMSFTDQWGSLSAVVAGFALAGYASFVLGMDRTLFSAELGFNSMTRVKRFPFGTIPHPMILGTMAGIAAMGAVPEFRQQYGWLIGAHLVCYAVVLITEVFEWRRRCLTVE